MYELIVRHFLACVSQDALGKETTVTIGVAGDFEAYRKEVCVVEGQYALDFSAVDSIVVQFLVD